ncbi:MAG: 5-methyltetrahydropteroyltriglutamate--homocysteine S-methyltransferase, partial [Streptococcaceae bacterium]|nr:5-methyltetrahydropteroyltriglutamate--homocysteine S-methyltransferase [Streptococcaceae bacterium]
MKTSIIGYPRIGRLRELKFATERFFRKEITENELKAVAKELRKVHWTKIKQAGISFIPSNDFSFYDTTLDTAIALNIIPKAFSELPVSDLERYFALARGYQGVAGDVKALGMKKWFNTNYHYMVPEFEDSTQIKANPSKLLNEYHEAKALGITTKPTILGPFTLLKLLKFTGQKQVKDIQHELAQAYAEILSAIENEEIAWLQLDEPALVFDLTDDDIQLFNDLYQIIFQAKKQTKLLLQTYFGDIRDIYQSVIALDFDAIGLDFVEGRRTLDLVKNYGFPSDKLLFAGVVNGKNIWANDYHKTLKILNGLPNKENIVISSSCSLLHVPYSVKQEEALDEKITQHFAFAEEKLAEIKEFSAIFFDDEVALLSRNQALFANARFKENKAVNDKVASLN